MNKQELNNRRLVSQDSMPIHECWKYGHIWKIAEDTFYLTSICKICGKIGERKRK